MWAVLASVVWGVGIIITVFAVLVAIALLFKRRGRIKARQDRYNKTGRTVVGFFHPFCDDGGGGERVLWCAIQGLQASRPDLDLVIYTGHVKDPENILTRVSTRFNITIKGDNIQFVFLDTRPWLEPQYYPYLTLIRQSFGGAVCGWEAAHKFYPDVFFDTMGWAFSYPVIRLLGDARISCYTHYPTVSSDMLKAVASRRSSHNNTGSIAQSSIASALKLLYYRLFARIYAWCGRFSTITMVNSSWTAGHISELWSLPDIRRPPQTIDLLSAERQVAIVYPACNTSKLQSHPFDNRDPHLVISIAQFRPEKNHLLQLQAVANLIARDPMRYGLVRLKLIGSARHEGDHARVQALREATQELGLQDNVEFVVNASFDKLTSLLGQATAGLHTMWMEHFGIGVVEFMAAGVIPIAHDSGGPRADIVTPERTGYLASTCEEYADCLEDVLYRRSAQERLALQESARKSVGRFSDETFQTRIVSLLLPLLPAHPSHDSNKSAGRRKDD